jgi:hypothetical protein
VVVERNQIPGLGGGGGPPGRAVQADPLKPTLKVPRTKPLKLVLINCFQLVLSKPTCAATAWQRLSAAAAAAAARPELSFLVGTRSDDPHTFLDTRLQTSCVELDSIL